MPTFELEFLPSARKEWDKLDKSVRNQFARKLAERLVAPRIASARLSGMAACYKIKLRAAGYRLVYRVEDKRVTAVVIAVGRRDRNVAYKAAEKRIG